MIGERDRPTPDHNILGETFYSEGAIRFGDYVAKLCAAPISESVLRASGAGPASETTIPCLIPSSNFSSKNSAEYELRAQLCTDLQRTPIEDASIDWPEEITPLNPWQESRFRLKQPTVRHAAPMQTTVCRLIHGGALPIINHLAPSCGCARRRTGIQRFSSQAADYRTAAHLRISGLTAVKLFIRLSKVYPPAGTGEKLD